MKIRHGFVSNSSSSSFCIYGVKIEVRELNKILNISNEEDYDYYKHMPSGFVCKNIPGEYDLYLGIPWKEIKGEETGNQFKERVRSTLSKLLNKEISCGTFDETWY